MHPNPSPPPPHPAPRHTPPLQATLARPPPTQRTMMRAVALSYVVVIGAYYSVACTGYAAFGAGVSSGGVRLQLGSEQWERFAGLGWLGWAVCTSGPTAPPDCGRGLLASASLG